MENGKLARNRFLCFLVKNQEKTRVLDKYDIEVIGIHRRGRKECKEKNILSLLCALCAFAVKREGMVQRFLAAAMPLYKIRNSI